jgi:hypothetical protein
MAEEYVAVGRLKLGKMKYASPGEVVVIKDRKERNHLLEIGAIAVKPEEPAPHPKGEESGKGEGDGTGSGKQAPTEKDDSGKK